MALLAASGGIGTIIGPAFGGLLARLGAVVPMYTAAGFAIVAAVLAAAKLAEPTRHVNLDAEVRLKISDGRIFPYLLGWFVIFMVFTAVQVITAFYIQDRFGVSAHEEVIKVASIALLSMAVVTLIVQIVVMQIWKVSPKVLLRLAYIIFAAVLMFFAYAETLMMLYVAYAGMGLSFAMAAPGLNAAASLAVEPAEQGAVAGLLSSAPAFGMVFGPALGGLVYDVAPDLPMIGGAVLSLLVGIYFLFVDIPDPKVEADS
jgi:MFS family permease